MASARVGSPRSDGSGLPWRRLRHARDRRSFPGALRNGQPCGPLVRGEGAIWLAVFVALHGLTPLSLAVVFVQPAFQVLMQNARNQGLVGDPFCQGLFLQPAQIF